MSSSTWTNWSHNSTQNGYGFFNTIYILWIKFNQSLFYRKSLNVKSILNSWQRKLQLQFTNDIVVVVQHTRWLIWLLLLLLQFIASLRVYTTKGGKDLNIPTNSKSILLMGNWLIFFLFRRCVFSAFVIRRMNVCLFTVSLFVQVISYVAYIIHFCSLVWKQIHSLCDVNISTRSSEQRTTESLFLPPFFHHIIFDVWTLQCAPEWLVIMD